MLIKRKLQWILLAFTATAFNTVQAASNLAPLPQQNVAAHISAEILSKHHYKPMALDDNLSAKIFDQYFKSLDGEKVFLLQSDIDSFAFARTKLDDALLKEDMRVPFAIFNLYQQRIGERYSYARSLLKKGFNFKRNESYQYTRKDASWPKSADELNDLWRKRVKNDWLRLKLAGKSKESIVDTLDKRYDNALSSLSKVKSEDVFQIFMNAYSMTIDPHTNYFGVRASEEFNISMRLSLMGIGAALSNKDEHTVIKELLAGGPAALSGKLNPGDRIVGVGQGGNSPITDIMGWRIDDAVDLIRGAEDTVVVLDVLPAEVGADGKHKIISLVRKKISLDKQAAKKSILDVKDGKVTRHIGVISLPGFYQDFTARQNGDKDFKSASRDVARLLAELKQDKVDGVLMDLRNNGGGSLDEAVELTGLFIDKGPVVQQRNSQGNIKIESDDDARVIWKGPLGVLINRGSASASEIFAAAIQDYGRGVVIGEKSFGKGTVQTIVDMDQLTKNDKPKFGELKMTVAQFFRIDGGTTQLRGVTPDITLETATDMDDFGESSFDNALPWTKIKAADYTPVANLSGIVSRLKLKHNQRVSQDKDFQYLRKDLAEFNAMRKKNQISLNEDDRRKEREIKEAREKLREKNKSDSDADKALAIARSHVLQDDGMQPGERNLKADKAIENATKNAKDILLAEAANILSDEAHLLKADPRLASNLAP